MKTYKFVRVTPKNQPQDVVQSNSITRKKTQFGTFVKDIAINSKILND